MIEHEPTTQAGWQTKTICTCEEQFVNKMEFYRHRGDAYRQQIIDAVRAVERAIADVRRWYDEAIFPPRPPGPHTEVYDGEAAAVARLTCDNIKREIQAQLKESE